MSKFSKQFNVWHIANDKKYRTATLYHKALCKHFRNWKSSEDYSELSQEVRALKIENEKLKADKQLVVVPKIFDKWIKDFDSIDDVSYWFILDRFVKANRYLKNDFFGLGDLEKYPQGWDRALMSALIDGYTIEKPKENLYVVKLPGVPTLNSYMCKSCSPGELGYNEKYSSKNFNEVRFGLRYYKKYSGGWQRQFTEQEIKDIDPRYLAFSVKVEED